MADNWIQYDFINSKVRPTHYSIKTAADPNSSPRNWVIEGTNSSNNNTWTILDEQESSTLFPEEGSITRIFEIIPKQKKKQKQRIVLLSSNAPDRCQ